MDLPKTTSVSETQSKQDELHVTKPDNASNPFTFVSVKQEEDAASNNSPVEEGNKTDETMEKTDVIPQSMVEVITTPGSSTRNSVSLNKQQCINKKTTVQQNYMNSISITEYRGNLKTGVKCYKYIITDKGEKRYLCQQCGKTYLRVGDLVKHGRTHSGEKPFTCETCNKTFSKKDVLREHYRIHTGVKPYSCDLCNKCFSKSGNLAIHRLIHTGEKTYNCDVCNKKFLLKGVLKLHYRIHTGEKPYVCDICNQAFSRSGHLASHQRTHTGEKHYNCEVCNKKFSQKHNLQRHSRTHISK